jgi:methylenetetrahydrofolate reductase (NADPH)
VEALKVSTMTQTTAAAKDLLGLYSVEVTGRDKKGIEAAQQMAPKGTEVFVANLPNDNMDRLVAACTLLGKAGLTPVPHMVARNTASKEELDDTLARLVGEAGITRALILGGDRDTPVGPFDSSIQLIQTGLFEKHGLKKVAIGIHPESHPRVPDEIMHAAQPIKVREAESRGLEVYLVSQFAFESQPFIDMARRLRAAGLTNPIRPGVAGPTSTAKLIKFALMCGVGASLRALREKENLAGNMLSGETPEALITELAAAQAAEPSLGFDSIHFFTFGALDKSVELAEQLKRG